VNNTMGQTLTEGEAALVETFRTLKDTLLAYGDELPPFARRNALKALASLWQVVNGLDMDAEQLYQLGA
jgi:hypothetical protein